MGNKMQQEMVPRTHTATHLLFSGYIFENSVIPWHAAFQEKYWAQTME
jgi:hypothetical protein